MGHLMGFVVLGHVGPSRFGLIFICGGPLWIWAQFGLGIGWLLVFGPYVLLGLGLSLGPKVGER